MALDSKRSVRNSVIASLISATILTLLQFVVPGGWPRVFANAVWLLSRLREWLAEARMVPTWVVLLLGVLSFSFLLITVARWISRRIAKRDPLANFREAEFFGVRWRWRLVERRIYDISSFCPVCDLQVHAQNTSGYRIIDRIIYACDTGHWHSDEFSCSVSDLEDRVRREIQREMRLRLGQVKE